MPQVLTSVVVNIYIWVEEQLSKGFMLQFVLFRIQLEMNHW